MFKCKLFLIDLNMLNNINNTFKPVSGNKLRTLTSSRCYVRKELVVVAAATTDLFHYSKP